MDKNLIAEASVTIDAPRSEVWDALVDPMAIRQYMFGTNVLTDWEEDSPIIWEGDWQGKKYKDKGTLLKVEEEKVLQYSHFSPLSGQPDKPENYHTVTIALSGVEGLTKVNLTQDNNETEEARRHSEKNWQTMLEGLKEYVER